MTFVEKRKKTWQLFYRTLQSWTTHTENGGIALPHVSSAAGSLCGDSFFKLYLVAIAVDVALYRAASGERFFLWFFGLELKSMSIWIWCTFFLIVFTAFPNEVLIDVLLV